MKTVTVELTNPVEMFDKPVKRIVLREPGYRAYSQLGEPYTYGRTTEGTEFASARESVIAEYTDKCVYDPSNEHGGAAVLALINNVTDARALRVATLSFFRDSAAEDSSEKSRS